jgi:hypothetical protein
VSQKSYILFFLLLLFLQSYRLLMCVFKRSIQWRITKTFDWTPFANASTVGFDASRTSTTGSITTQQTEILYNYIHEINVSECIKISIYLHMCSKPFLTGGSVGGIINPEMGEPLGAVPVGSFVVVGGALVVGGDVCGGV